MNKNVPCTKCFSILGVGSRMEIYKYLKEKSSSSVNELVDFVGLTQPTVSYHLKEMKDAGLLKSEKKGKEVVYEISGMCLENKSDCVLNSIEFPINHA